MLNLILLFFLSCCFFICSVVNTGVVVAATAVAVSVVVTNVKIVPVAFDTAAAKVGIGAADFVVIGTAVSVRSVTTVCGVVGTTVLLL